MRAIGRKRILAAQREALPLLARCLIAATAVAAIAVLLGFSDHEVHIQPLTTFAVLAMLGIVFESMPLTVSYKGQLFALSLGSAFILGMMTIFGILPAVLLQAVASVLADLRAGRSWLKIVFNAPQLVIAVAAAGYVLERVIGYPIVYPGMSFSSNELPPMLLALLVFTLVNNLFTGAIMQIMTGWKFRDVMQRFISWESFIDGSSLLLVPLMAVSIRHNPWFGLFLIIPVGALYRATKLAMENVTLLETQAIALEEKFLAEKMARDGASAMNEADRANRAKSMFLSEMSHELRTPLNAVLGFTQLLEMGDLRPDQRESTEEILKAGKHLLGLIDGVLDISSIEAGRLRLDLAPVNVARAIDECVGLIAPLAKQARVTIHSDHLRLSGKAALVTADDKRLNQILLNLLSNAIKYNREGGSVRVSVALSEDRRVRITVGDTGHGIPEERLDELFTPFERLGAEGSRVQGTGLGLALTKPLVEAMGGTIQVRSERGVGTTFFVELDAAEHPVRTNAA